jgi:hypothetical protein
MNTAKLKNRYAGTQRKRIFNMNISTFLVWNIEFSVQFAIS